MDFEDYRDAEDAVYDLHKKEFMGEVVSTRIYNLSENLFPPSSHLKSPPKKKEIWESSGLINDFFVAN